MKWFLDVLRGAVIGLANVIPGVSGGTMMVSMGIYDKLIYSINNLFKKFKECFKILLCQFRKCFKIFLILFLEQFVILLFLDFFVFFNHLIPINTTFLYERWCLIY